MRKNVVTYFPSLDGLRALAVLAVLLYHSGFDWIPGGFLGVEVFFVISGFLITSILLTEWHRGNRIDVKGFWLRRSRRLLPAVYVLIAAVMAFAVISLPQEVAGLRGDAVASFTYITNWYLILEQQSYFQATGRPSLLKHLWSLAVEEQFYIVWPLIFFAGMRFLRQRWFVLLILGGAAASTAWMAFLYVPDADPSRVYYGTDTRATGLLFGAALAFLWSPQKIQSRFSSAVLDVLGLIAFGLLLLLHLKLGEFQPLLYQGGFALVALATVAVIALALHPGSRFVPKLLGNRLMAGIGLRSYSIYLWHWPIFMITRPQLDVPFDGIPLLLFRLSLTCILAELSYRFVETPFRKGALGRAWKALCESHGLRHGLLVSQWGGIALVVVVLGITVGFAKPPEPPAYLQVESIDTIIDDSTPTLAAETATPVISVTSTPLSIIATAPVAISTATPASESVAISTVTPTAPKPASTETKTVPTATVVGGSQGNLTPTVVNTPTTTATTPPASKERVTAVGDSVMLGAANELERAIGNVEVDAAVSRQVSAAIDDLRSRRSTGKLGPIVVLHVGNNGTFSTKQFDEIMQILNGVRTVIFVNLKVPRQWESPNNSVLVDGVKRYPNTVLVDWRSASINRPDFFWDDGIHLRPEGARVYADNIAAQLRNLQNLSSPGQNNLPNRSSP